MALEDIFRALEEQATQDIEQIMADAQAHAKAIIDEAEQQAGGVRSARVSEAERQARARSTQGLNAARLEARKRQAGVKEQAIESVFDDALVRLDSVRGDVGYRDVFARLAAEALAGVEEEFEVLVDPADVSLAEEVLASLGKSAPVRGDISTSGGLVVVTGGGSISRRNTFEARLEKLRSIAQADVAEIVFS
jgi:V/A-type H+/Na+-transporting ATPase subunit E